MNIVRSVGPLTVVCIVALTACGTQISDTGYTGTWGRKGLNTETTLAIAQQDGEYLFRWGRESPDGRLRVRCDWTGACEETFDGEQTATYQMRAWIDDESGLLHVECRGKRTDAKLGEVDIQYLDELVTRDHGTRLISRVIGKDGVRLEGGGHGKREFEKISDSVVDPPPGSGAGG